MQEKAKEEEEVSEFNPNESVIVRIFNKPKKVIKQDPESEERPRLFSIIPLHEDSEEEKVALSNKTLRQHFFGKMKEFRSYSYQEKNVTFSFFILI